MKRMDAILLAVLLAVSVCGCSREMDSTDNRTGSVKEMEDKRTDEGPALVLAEEQPEEPVQEEKQPEEGGASAADAFSFADLKNYVFYFSSGAGGWATEVNIQEDGSFSGQYFDSDMGDAGEGYPDGTLYQCSFTGQFTPPVRINEYTYSAQISRLDYEEEAGKEEIEDGIRHCYTDAYGLAGAENILIYLPGAPFAELPEEFRGWIRNSGILDETETKLSSYALNNEADQYGFSGHVYDAVNNLKESVASYEELAASLEDSIQKDPLTQAELNEKSLKLYEIWDSALNDIWNVLKRTKDEETMAALIVEERSWIAEKEQALSRIKEEYEGGSILAFAVNRKAADMTKERVYELMELLK